MKVRAAVLRQVGQPAPYALSQPLVIETVELAPPGPGELCVRVLAAGLCHSDLSVIDGSRLRPMPMVLGHEATGEIVELGADVQGFRVGDRVVFCFIPNCGRCEPCASGRPALCELGAAANAAGTLLGGGRRWLDGNGRDVASSSRRLRICRIHRGISALRGAHRPRPRSRDRSLIRVCRNDWRGRSSQHGEGLRRGKRRHLRAWRRWVGCSPRSARIRRQSAHCNRCAAHKFAAYKFELARELGATHCVDAGDGDAIDRVREISRGGVQFAIESVGSERVLAQAYAATRRGGTTVTVGLPSPDRMLSVPALSLVTEERTIKGSYMGSAVPSRDVARFIALYRAGHLPVDRMLTHRLQLDEINTGFDRLVRAETIRQVVLL